MEIQYINIDEIVEYKNNVKIHTQEQIEQIMTSIERYGNNDPIAIDENNVIIEGHGRYLALKELGEIEIPVIQLKHLTEDQKREYILVHNKLTMNTGFDIDKLQEELNLINFDMSFFSFENADFNEDDLHSLFQEVEEAKQVKEKEVKFCPHCGEVID